MLKDVKMRMHEGGRDEGGRDEGGENTDERRNTQDAYKMRFCIDKRVAWTNSVCSC